METRGRGCGRNHPKVLLMIPTWFLPVWKSNIQISLVDTQVEALPEAGPPNSRSPRGSLTRLTPMDQLVDMGFKNERENQKALRACRSDVSQAALWLSVNNDESATANTRGRGRGGGDDI